MGERVIDMIFSLPNSKSHHPLSNLFSGLVISKIGNPHAITDTRHVSMGLFLRYVIIVRVESYEGSSYLRFINNFILVLYNDFSKVIALTTTIFRHNI